MHRLGVGPAPLPARDLTIAALAERISALDQPEYRRRAAAIGARVQAEDGVGMAAARIVAEEPGN